MKATIKTEVLLEVELTGDDLYGMQNKGKQFEVALDEEQTAQLGVASFVHLRVVRKEPSKE